MARIITDAWRLNLESFLGVPVLVQLKIPLVMAQVHEAQPLLHADNQERQWVPSEASGAGDQLAVTQVLRYAVLRACSSDPGRLVEVHYLGPGPGGTVTLASVVHLTDIAAITRVVSAPPVPDPTPMHKPLIQLQ